MFGICLPSWHVVHIPRWCGRLLGSAATATFHLSRTHDVALARSFAATPAAVSTVQGYVLHSIPESNDAQATLSEGSAEISNILNKPSPEFLKVPFVEEDMDVVMSEVPEFRYYYIGNSDYCDNPFRNVPLTKGIYEAGSEGTFEPTDDSVKFAKLQNGLRIAAVDKGGMETMLGLYVGAGSRFERPEELGVSSMIENMAFHSTAHLSHLRTIKTVETLGGNASCNAFREHISYQGECLRKDMPIMLNLLIGNVLFPRFLPWEMKANKDRLNEKRKQIQETPDLLITELLHSVAWHNNTLGLPNFCTEPSLANYTPEILRNFMLRHFAPDNCVIVGINTQIEELSKWTMRAYNDYNAIEPVKRDLAKPVYNGGVKYHEDNNPLLHIAVGYEISGGWKTPELVIFTVLQALMGGGGAFSTGGPGKGMHSRLFLNVLNRHEFVESCMAFSTVYSDTGIFGIYMVAAPHASTHALDTIAREFKALATVTPKELERAKNSLKSFLHMSLEHKPVQMEDIARQLLLCNRVLSPAELERAIDSVTAADIKSAVQKMLKRGKPSIVASGNLAFMPHPEELPKFFKN